MPTLRTFDTIEWLKHITLRRWLLIAAVFHVLLTLAVYLTGYLHLMPGSFNEQGIGLSLAPDGLLYQRLSADMADMLRRGEFRSWLNFQTPFHCRLYSLTFVLPGSLIGYNILAAEVLNLAYFLGILTVVYFLGKETFDSRAGVSAAAVVAVWPSFLLHSTQLVRDSLAIICMLGLLLVLTRVVGNQFRGPGIWRNGIAGIALVILFWITRGNMWNLMLVELAITFVLLVIEILRRKRIPFINLALLFLIAVAVLLVPSRIESTTVPGSRPPRALLEVSSSQRTSGSIWDRLQAQINGRRRAFSGYTGNSSNIDTDTNFQTIGDIVRYLPRAAEIGLFAPFPRTWFEAGAGGRAARIAAGCETFIMYLLYMPAVICLWYERRNLKMWLIFLFSVASMISLGMVVVNAGALFRLRYVFWMMVIVLAVKGIWIWRDVREASIPPRVS